MNEDHARPVTTEPPWVGDVLRFWFDELSPTQWFTKDADLDGQIRERFLGLYERLLAGTEAHPASARGALAAVIVLDQFPRNIFRGDPRAFATDPIARRIAKTAIASNFDAALSTAQRLFLYLPLEHSEDLDDQMLAVRLIESLGDAEWTKYAIAHKDIIERFGRFPHRNAILGRPSTPAEVELLNDPMGSF